MKRIILSLTAFVVVFLFASLAHAADGADPVAVTILTHVIDIIAVVLSALAAWVAVKVGKWVNAKTGVEVDGLLETYAAKGVAYAEERAHKILKEKGEKLKGPEKLELALQFAMALAEQQKLPEKAKAKLEEYIESKIGERRATNADIRVSVQD